MAPECKACGTYVPPRESQAQGIHSETVREQGIDESRMEKLLDLQEQGTVSIISNSSSYNPLAGARTSNVFYECHGQLVTTEQEKEQELLRQTRQRILREQRLNLICRLIASPEPIIDMNPIKELLDLSPRYANHYAQEGGIVTHEILFCPDCSDQFPMSVIDKDQDGNPVFPNCLNPNHKEVSLVLASFQSQEETRYSGYSRLPNSISAFEFPASFRHDMSDRRNG